MSSTQDIERGGGGRSRKMHPWVIVAIVMGVVVFMIPVLIVAITLLGTSSGTEFSEVGSLIG